MKEAELREFIREVINEEMEEGISTDAVPSQSAIESRFKTHIKAAIKKAYEAKKEMEYAEELLGKMSFDRSVPIKIRDSIAYIDKAHSKMGSMWRGR